MSYSTNAILAGFGGQGVLFAGKLIVTAGLLEDREVSWLPSYGPEMRGGTANCSICLADDPIGSPLVTAPDVLIAMNQPSFDKFVSMVAPGGMIIVDSSLVKNVSAVEGVTIHEVPATQLAEENGCKGLSNVLLVGKFFAETKFCTKETLEAAMRKCVPPRKEALLSGNFTALQLGMNA